MQGSIFDKRFVIVAGKGGVGRSVVSSTLAMCAASRGKKVLIVEMASKERCYDLFGRTNPSDYTPSQVFAGIDSINIQPEPALREYGMMKLRWERVFKIVFENKVMKSLTQMIPGMNELLLLGKAWHLEQSVDPKTGGPMWDFIVVDAPATGHGMSLLQLPQVVAKTMTSGPITEETREIANLLHDRERCCVSIVTRPEEMPVNEALQFANCLDDPLNVGSGFLFINGVWPDLLPDESRGVFDSALANTGAKSPEKAMLETMQFRLKRREIQQRFIDRLGTECALPQIQLPYLFAAQIGFDEINKLSPVIDAAVDRYDHETK